MSYLFFPFSKVAVLSRNTVGPHSLSAQTTYSRRIAYHRTPARFCLPIRRSDGLTCVTTYLTAHTNKTILYHILNKDKSELQLFAREGRKILTTGAGHAPLRPPAGPLLRVGRWDSKDVVHSRRLSRLCLVLAEPTRMLRTCAFRPAKGKDDSGGGSDPKIFNLRPI
jgi:hypothetical protein